MKKLLLIVAALACGLASRAQDTPVAPWADEVSPLRDDTVPADTTKAWNHSGSVGLNLSQVSLSNWAAGGDASVSFDANLALSVDYLKAKNLWKNRIELAYGMSNTTSDGIRKNNDKIYLSSMYGYQVAKAWYAGAMVSYTTQFANGYDYDPTPPQLISQFMAPGYLTSGFGMIWTPNKWFTATLSPASWRGTFVMSDSLSQAGAYGVDPGKQLRNEFGANTVFEAKYEFLPNMTIYTRLGLYSNYLKNAQNVDVNWDTQLVMKINKWFSATAGLTMIYDDDTRFLKDGRMMALLQTKEVLGIGLLLHF